MSETKPKRSPRDIHHGAFTSEGRLAAFPTCFPGASVPITADESLITALDVSMDGDVYGGTSGKQTHLFVGMFRGITGAVFDMAAIEDAQHCAAVCCGRREFAAFVNGDKGGRILIHRLQGLPFDLIQEWGFRRSPCEEIGVIPDGGRIIHAATDPSRQFAVGVSEGHLFVVNLEDKSFQLVGAVKGRGRVGVGSEENFYGLDTKETLWRFHLPSRTLERHAIPLPKGAWTDADPRWARDPRSGLLYIADSDGNLFAFDEKNGFSEPLGQTPLAPVTTMAVTLDGRLFGTCGAEMEHLFTYDPRRKEIRDLWIAASTIQRRRYGYLFGDAAVGIDGEIYFGEKDNLGHLWLYFPRIEG